jgi:membrane-associated phospholipid phosphatase
MRPSYSNFLSWIIVFLFVMILQPFCFAQETTPLYLKLNRSFVVSSAKDAANAGVAPIKWKKQQWIEAIAIGGATALLWTQDAQIRNFMQRNTITVGHELSRWYFDPLPTYYLAAFTVGMYIYGLTTHNPNTETVALLTGKSVVITAFYTTLLKGVFQRERPFGGSPPNPDQWGGPLGGFRHGAFPSRHVSMSFAAATVLSSYYNDRVWIGLTSYTLASLVALSQMHEDKHWATDVLAGAALGYALGKLVINKHRQSNCNVSFSPEINVKYAGLGIKWHLK